MTSSSLILDLRTSSYRPETGQSLFLDLNLNTLKQLSDGFSRATLFVVQLTAHTKEKVCSEAGGKRFGDFIFVVVGVFIFL